MGCDMHAIAEMSNADGKWEMVAEFGIDRDYDLFANLATCGRSEHIKPICPPRGWPADLSLGGQRLKEFWSGDGHSAGYLFASEILRHSFVDRFGNPLALPGWLADFGRGEIADVRLVFCFDN